MMGKVLCERNKETHALSNYRERCRARATTSVPFDVFIMLEWRNNPFNVHCPAVHKMGARIRRTAHRDMICLLLFALTSPAIRAQFNNVDGVELVLIVRPGILMKSKMNAPAVFEGVSQADGLHEFLPSDPNDPGDWYDEKGNRKFLKVLYISFFPASPCVDLAPIIAARKSNGLPSGRGNSPPLRIPSGRKLQCQPGDPRVFTHRHSGKAL